MKINSVRLGISGGTVWGACMFLTTLDSLFLGYGTEMLKAFESIYPGYTISLSGALIGGAYGFVDMFVFLFLIAWIYNKLNHKNPL